MFPALLADTARQISGVGSMPEVAPAVCGQRSLKLLGPFPVGPGEPPHLIGRQAQITEHGAERLAAADGLEKLLPHLDWEPLLRSGSTTSPLVIAVCPTTEGAAAPGIPAGVRPVLHIAHRRTLTRTS
jgi:hypothetical protein